MGCRNTTETDSKWRDEISGPRQSGRDAWNKVRKWSWTNLLQIRGGGTRVARRINAYFPNTCISTSSNPAQPLPGRRRCFHSPPQLLLPEPEVSIYLKKHRKINKNRLINTHPSHCLRVRVCIFVSYLIAGSSQGFFGSLRASLIFFNRSSRSRAESLLLYILLFCFKFSLEAPEF